MAGNAGNAKLAELQSNKSRRPLSRKNWNSQRRHVAGARHCRKTSGSASSRRSMCWQTDVVHRFRRAERRESPDPSPYGP